MKYKPHLAPIRLKYKQLPGVPAHLWPIIELNIRYKNKTTPHKLLALIDSGASNSIIRPNLARLLGVDLGKGKQFSGASVSGSHKSILLPEELDVNIYGHEFGFRFYAIEGMIWDCILGEDTIFEVARLDFQKFKGFFEVRFRTDIN